MTIMFKQSLFNFGSRVVENKVPIGLNDKILKQAHRYIVFH